jgi:acetoin utilization deacetylase AcuC-like enzyme
MPFAPNASLPTLVLTHDAFVKHGVPAGHPERPDRIRAVWRVLERMNSAAISREATHAGRLDLARLVHDDGYVDILAKLEAPAGGFIGIDADTVWSPGTGDAIRHAIGGAERLVKAVMSGEARNGFLAARPPGHHAERDKAMGFCFVNTAALIARLAQQKHGIKRVAIMDFDVHHGNGTQDIFWSDASVMYASTHEMPLYPGTGNAHETGAHGNIVNAPLRGGDGSAEFRAAITDLVLPGIRAFEPELVVISAGFDAHALDPLASLQLRGPDFAFATRELMAIADASAKGRIISVLEGGYDLDGLSEGVEAHLAALSEAAAA